MTKIAIIPGSTRTGSFNVKLGVAIKQALESNGGDVTLVDLADFPMPIFDQDLEEKSGPPQKAIDLAALIAENQGVVLVNPEYNASMTPLMKNTIDWLSRGPGGSKPYQNRAFALASCSPGALGGIRGLSHVRDSLISIGAQEVISPQIGVGNAGKAFDEDGNLTVERLQDILQNFCDRLIEAANRYT